MSTFFIVEGDEDDSSFLTEDFADAMWQFLRLALNGDPATLKYSP